MDVPADVHEEPNDHLTGPDSLHDLGDIRHGVFIDPEGSVAFDTKGPNREIAHWGSLPLTYEGIVQVNRAQLAVGSAFWRAQPERLPAYSNPIPCIRAQVEPFIGKVLTHEGIGLSEHSHAGLYLRVLVDSAGPAAEGQTPESIPELRDRTGSALKPVIAAAKKESDRADTEFAPVYCTFNYDYSASKTKGKP